MILCEADDVTDAGKDKVAGLINFIMLAKMVLSNVHDFHCKDDVIQC